jgi:hypothetical protein
VRRVAVLLALLVGVLLLALPVDAADFDCKESPTPDMPGQGLAGFFGPEPDTLPIDEDPFTSGASTTVYEQYGFAGIRWHNYDLGCGPDAAQDPEAVIGTAISNWVMNLPVAITALTSSLTAVAFEPTFLDVFDPMLTRVSTALHESLFARWVPAIIALIGIMLLVKARGMALATAAAAVGWALFVVIVTTALFRWPVEAGHFADDTVTTSLGSVVEGLNGGRGQDAATAVASSVHDSVLYTSWLAGTLGSTDSETARKYGPELFKATALTWREAELVHSDPEAGKELIEEKKNRFGEIADTIREEDPTAYEYLTGKRSDTRVGYAFLAALATILALPFLLVSSLLLIASFLIVRLAVMMFPAFATLGLFPAARGIVIGVGRTVGAALINAVIFGVGAAVTIVVLGLILDPATGIPGWLTLVLLPLFSLIMWAALKPFRRLTSMAGMSGTSFAEGTSSLSSSASSVGRLTKKVTVAAASAYTGGAAAGAAAAQAMKEQQEEQAPERAEARVDTSPPPARATRVVPALEAAPSSPAPEPVPSSIEPSGPASLALTSAASRPAAKAGEDVPPVDVPVSESVALAPTEPEWYDGEEIYPIYRPGDDRDDAPEAALA